MLKLYPGRLQIAITEREAFALWQKDGKVTVIAADGTVVEPFVAQRFAKLPLVVGARRRNARPRISSRCSTAIPRSATRCAPRSWSRERRWNLRLKNGIDVRLPEADVERRRSTTLVALDRDKKLLSRDIAAIDLRLPDRVTVRLSDDAAQARDDALKAKKPKKQGRRRMSLSRRPHPEDEAGVAASARRSSPRSTSAPARSSA